MVDFAEFEIVAGAVVVVAVVGLNFNVRKNEFGF